MKRDYSFKCVKCGKAAERNAYCVAQQALGHTVWFTCECGKRQRVPKMPPRKGEQ
jgi:RNase P subunit RPR2